MGIDGKFEVKTTVTKVLVHIMKLGSEDKE